MIFGSSILRKFDINSLYIYLYTVATLLWEIRKVIFNIFIYILRLFTLSQKKTICVNYSKVGQCEELEIPILTLPLLNM